MPCMIGLLSPVFIQRMCPFNSLPLPLPAAQPVLMRHRGHQVDKHVIDGGYQMTLPVPIPACSSPPFLRMASILA